MSEEKTSPNMAALLTEKYWAIPEEARRKMMYDYLNRATPCHVCKCCVIRVRALDNVLYYRCSENLAPREGCLMFELDNSKVIMGSDIACQQKNKEEKNV